MTRAELAILSQAHAVAYMAMAAPETGRNPVAAAAALEQAAIADMPGFAVPCSLFRQRIGKGHVHPSYTAQAGWDLRDAVARAMSMPVDAHRADLHGDDWRGEAENG